MKNTFTNFEEYFLLFPKDVQTKLEALRKTVHAQTPELEEYIGYKMPAFRYNKKPLVYFAAYKNHIGFYPASEGMKNFEKDFIVRKFKFSKGAVQFPLNEDLPLDLVERMVKYKIAEIEDKKS
ncbi:DUF1801 domain-containing protein [Chryseobacterium sp. Leaf394]|uniref:iron chaperone n=1 Tax=Chryseobacterium sp. Leaf394 TaxID=1736361 RepID=UPI0006F4A04F|nr:DUF1801 domain-containing protein [Chryseobacterium sp. Leaf394]KQS90211.1 hypothetical protein ASG21_14745 [Chryseobacterium sp. Leaf394]